VKLIEFKPKDYIKERWIGFYVTILVAVLCIITAAVYPVQFAAVKSSDLVYRPTIAFLIVGGVMALVCLAAPMVFPFLKRWLLPVAPYFTGVAGIIGLGTFVKPVVSHLSKGVGMESEFSDVLALIVLFALIAVLGTAGFFLRVSKKETQIKTENSEEQNNE